MKPIVIHEVGTTNFYGYDKEQSGAIVKGESEEEVMKKILNAVKAINTAMKKDEKGSISRKK